MGTKNSPAPFDCYANAEPDEPMFILLGRDPVAGLVVHVWALARCAMGQTASDPQIAEAFDCADAMTAWSLARGKDVSRAARALGAIGATLGRMGRAVLERFRAPGPATYWGNPTHWRCDNPRHGAMLLSDAYPCCWSCGAAPPPSAERPPAADAPRKVADDAG